jgi:hypothetical protein
MVLFYGDPLNSARGCIQMAVTAVVVTKNVCMSMCWKAESVTYGICNQPSPKFVHLLPLKPDRLPVCQVRPESFQHLILIQNPIAIKPCIGIGHMSNQRKSEFVSGNFGI